MNPHVAASLRRQLLQAYPWVKPPFLISAPMRILAGPHLAVAVSSAGGLGFIGPAARPQDTLSDLESARALLGCITPPSSPASALPVGIGFQTWNGDLQDAAAAVHTYAPCAAWLFAPRNGQAELDEWSAALRRASPATQIWIQVGTVDEAVAAARSPQAPDVLVLQGAEAGGHGRAVDGQGTVVLLPEAADAVLDALSHASSSSSSSRSSSPSGSLRRIPLVAAGGIIDGRGVAAALGLGAAGVAMGTRMLAASEARISKGYQAEVLRTSDGAKCTVRTHLYNHLRGTFGWPEQFAPRTVINRSWVEHRAGVPFEELKARHDEAAETGDAGWGPEGRLATYAGAGVGLVRSVQDADVIIKGVREEARAILRSLVDVA